MTANDHLHPQQFDPKTFDGYLWSEHGFGVVDTDGKVLGSTNWDANQRGQGKDPGSRVVSDSRYPLGRLGDEWGERRMHKFVPSDYATRVN